MTQSTHGDNTIKELIRKHWNRRAATFDEESHHGIHSAEQHDRWLTVWREWIGDGPLRVLDVGCGTGVVSVLLAELDHDVVGVDFAPEMLEHARTKVQQTAYSIEFLRGDAEALSLPDNSVELVTARHLVWTLPNPIAAFQEWQRVVEPGGRILLIEGYWDHDEPWDEYKHVHDDLPMYDGRPPAELKEALVRAGFSDVTYEPLLDATLWGREPLHDYYIIRATVTR